MWATLQQSFMSSILVLTLVLPTTAMSEASLNVRAMAAVWRRDLLENVIPFWETYSLDQEHGGYFTCLDRDGSCLDTSKFM